MYTKVDKITRRLNKLLSLLNTSSFTAGGLADELKVSIPTIYRDIDALRKSGYEIEAVRNAKGWHYKLVSYNGQLEIGY